VVEPEPGPARPLTVAVDLDLGNDFRVRGRGIDTRLRGTLAVGATDLTNPRLTGTITTAGGEYRAYGQRLDVDRGVIRFTGALDNPALDILAIRPNLTQRVGVLISGRAQSPFIRLYAEPDLSEAEKLSWLVLGRSSASGGAEAALLQQAALALLAARTGGTGPGLASRFGLDELSFRRDGEGGPAVTLGRRFARNFYAAYERSLSGAVGTLFLFYELTERFTVRAQAGERTAVDIIYTFSYD
jgi:translocation and assembly module TamB